MNFGLIPMTKLSKTPGVYCLWNTLSGKLYVGSSDNIAKRIEYHFSGHCHNRHLKSAINHYGVKAFNITFCECENYQKEEQRLLNFIFTNDIPKYNVATKVGGGKILADYTEHGKKVSTAIKLRAMPIFGLDLNSPEIIVTFESNLQASDKLDIDRSIVSRSARKSTPANSKTSRWLFSNKSIEHLVASFKKLSAVQIRGGRSLKGGDNPFYGKKHTTETKEQLRKFTAEQEQKIKAEFEEKAMTQVELAQRYNCSYSLIKKIVRRVT